MTPEQIKLVDRIRKLLALADPKSGATEFEAQAAALKVQQLLQDNGMSMAQIEGRGSTGGGSRKQQTTDRRAMYKWQVDLMSTLADCNFLMHWTEKVRADDGRRSKRHVLLGRDVNIEITLSMYDYLSTAIRRAASNEGYTHAPGSESDHHTFLGAATERLESRLKRQKYEREQEEQRRRDEARTAARHPGAAPSTGTELVLAEVYQSEEDFNNDLRAGLPPGTHAARRAKEAAEKAARDARFAELKARGIDYDVAWYMVWYNQSLMEATASVAADRRRDEAAREAAKKAKPRKGREYRYTQAERREDERRNSSAFRAGERAGDSISLNKQVRDRKEGRLS